MRDVLRVRVGDAIACFDGQGREYVGKVARMGRHHMAIEFDQSLHKPVVGARVWLLSGVPKGERMDWLIQKVTELGVMRVVPLQTRHSIVRFAPEQGRRKLERWRRIAREAAKQSGRSTVPEIESLTTLEQALPARRDVPLVVMPTLAVTTVPLRDVITAARERAPSGGHQSAPAAVAVLIGPEGDFSRDEIALAETYGARPVSLGPLILRSETAALAAISMLRYALDMG